MGKVEFYRSWRRYWFMPIFFPTVLTLLLLLPGFAAKVVQAINPAWLSDEVYLTPFVTMIAVFYLWVYGGPVFLVGAFILFMVRRRRPQPPAVAEPAPSAMRFFRTGAVAAVAALACILFAYLWWPIFTLDDGPFFATPYTGDVSQLKTYGDLPLKRFGRTVYVLESKLLDEPETGSVLVLRDTDGSVRWQMCPNDSQKLSLGPIELSREHSRVAWWGGWTVAIKPQNTEGGELYLGPRGGFRYFYLSW